MLKTNHFDHTVLDDVITSKALILIPKSLQSQPVFLSIDDAIIEKSAKKINSVSNCMAIQLTIILIIWMTLHGQPVNLLPAQFLRTKSTVSSHIWDKTRLEYGIGTADNEGNWFPVPSDLLCECLPFRVQLISQSRSCRHCQLV